ncbi:MAG: discoidin domain-containing protein [Brevinematales bacterium]|jgi:hypothetical protein
MKGKISIFLAAAACFFCLQSYADGTRPNLALNKPAVCSSFEKANQYNGNKDSVPGLVTDGDKQTRWSSDYFNDADPNLAWIYVDLGSKVDISEVKIFWEAAMAKVFSIEVSDDAKTWTSISDIKGNFLPQTDVKIDKPVSGRYVRINCKERKTQYGYSIFEIEVY